MAQHNNEHLTTAQLSAYVDKELAPDERAFCDAHLPTCQICQTTLIDLRLTSTMLHSLPQVEVPRSFVLPNNLVVLPQMPTREEPRVRQTGRNQQVWRRTLRSLSTIAALLGVLLILFGALSGIYGVRTAANSSSTRSAPVSTTFTQIPQPQSTNSAAGNSSPSEQHTPSTTTERTPTSEETPSQASNPRPPSSDQQVAPPAVLDLGKPEGRLGIGAILLVMGILGVILTRRLRHNSARSHI